MSIKPMQLLFLLMMIHIFISKSLEIIEDYFFENANCGLVAFRNFLGKNKTDI
jgi:hypothetical protein